MELDFENLPDTIILELLYEIDDEALELLCLPPLSKKIKKLCVYDGNVKKRLNAIKKANLKKNILNKVMSSNYYKDGFTYYFHYSPMPFRDYIFDYLDYRVFDSYQITYANIDEFISEHPHLSELDIDGYNKNGKIVAILFSDD